MADKHAALQGLRDQRTNTGVVARYGDLGLAEGGLPAYAPVVYPASAAGASTALADGQLTATSTAAPLQVVGSGTVCAEVLVQNDPSSTVPVQVGTAAAQDQTLQPGEWQAYAVLNTAQVYISAPTGAPLVNWLARSATGGAVTGITTTAAALATNAATDVVVQSAITNTVNLLLGGADAQHIVLIPGAVVRIAVTNSNLLYLKAASAASNQTAFYQVHTKL